MMMMMMMMMITMMSVDGRRESSGDSKNWSAIVDAFTARQVVHHCSHRCAHVYIRRSSGRTQTPVHIISALTFADCFIPKFYRLVGLSS